MRIKRASRASVKATNLLSPLRFFLAFFPRSTIVHSVQEDGTKRRTRSHKRALVWDYVIPRVLRSAKRLNMHRPAQLDALVNAFFFPKRIYFLFSCISNRFCLSVFIQTNGGGENTGEMN